VKLKQSSFFGYQLGSAIRRLSHCVSLSYSHAASKQMLRHELNQKGMTGAEGTVDRTLSLSFSL